MKKNVVMLVLLILGISLSAQVYLARDARGEYMFLTNSANDSLAHSAGINMFLGSGYAFSNNLSVGADAGAQMDIVFGDFTGFDFRLIVQGSPVVGYTFRGKMPFQILLHPIEVGYDVFSGEEDEPKVTYFQSGLDFVIGSRNSRNSTVNGLALGIDVIWGQNMRFNNSRTFENNLGMGFSIGNRHTRYALQRR